MALDFKFQPAMSRTKDLTTTVKNPGATAMATPRQGGFTLRNRINFANVATADKKLCILTASASTNPTDVLLVLEVPNRTIVRTVDIFGVPSLAVPQHAIVTASGAASLLSTAIMAITGATWSKPDTATRVLATHCDLITAAVMGEPAGAPFGNVGITSQATSCNFTATQVEKIDSSMTTPYLGRLQTNVAIASAVNAYGGIFYPYGGYVALTIGPYNTGTSSASSTAAAEYSVLSGGWEIQANCGYVPE